MKKAQRKLGFFFARYFWYSCRTLLSALRFRAVRPGPHSFDDVANLHPFPR